VTFEQPFDDPADDDPAAFYVPLGDGRYRPTIHTQGAWSPDEQHMAPVSGLLTDAIETASGRTDLVTSRISFDILGMIHRTEVQITASVIRPGRTIELVQAEMSAGGRTLVRATAWRLATSDTTDLAGSELPEMPGPDQATVWDGTRTWDGGFIAGLEFRVLPGRRPGRGQVWIRTDNELVHGRQAGDLPSFVALIDSANGIAVRVDPAELLFPNTDLSIHVIRQPRGRWLGLDTSVSFGPEGVGLTSSVLHDEQGPVGIAAQSLTLRRRG
jgi:hypothetical protein